MVKRTLFFAWLLLLSMALLGILASQGCQPSAEQAKAQKETKDEAALPPEAVEHFRQAHKFLAEQKMDEAFKEFQETARLAPKAPLAQFWLAQVHFLKKDKDQAEKIFLKVLELDPDNYHTMAMLGKLYSMDKDKADQAEEYLKKALKQSPDYLEAHFDLGRVYAMKGDRDRTFREFRYLFDKEREFFLYHFEMGRILEAWGDKAQALNHYRRAHFLNPRFDQAVKAAQRLEQEVKAAQPAGGQGAAPAAAPASSPPPKTPPPAKPSGSK